MRAKEIFGRVLMERMPEHVKNDPALMTWNEYQKYMNPGDKSHPSEAYNWDISEMNSINKAFSDVNQYMVNNTGRNKDIDIRTNSDKSQYMIFKDKDIVGWVKDGTLNIQKHAMERDIMYYFGDLDIKYVKYPEKHFRGILGKMNREKYPTLVQNIKSRGERFQIRKDDKNDYAILNSDQMKVAVAQDEWGAILVSVAKEYRGFGFGTMLGKIYREAHPEKNTGGVTYDGSKQVRRVWVNFVREALATGRYSDLVRDGKLTKARVQAILGDLEANERRPKSDRSNEPEKATKDKDYGNWLIMNYDNTYVVIYHRDVYKHGGKNFNAPDFELVKNHIIGHALIRDFQDEDFLFKIDYENHRAEIMIILACLDILHRENRKLNISMEAADFSESIYDIKGVYKDDDHIWIEDEIPGLEASFEKERIIRNQYDKYDEFKNSIIEAADAKYQ